MKILNLQKEDRPREKAIRGGIESLTNAELIAVLLRTGESGRNVLEISNELLTRAEGKLSNIISEDRPSVRGIGKVKWVTILAAFELGKRLYMEPFRDVKVIRNSEQMYSMIDPVLRFCPKEECRAYYFDPRGRLLGEKLLTRGTAVSTLIDSKQILKDAVMMSATGVILVHNHPSGSPEPSEADCVATLELKNALKAVDVNLNDHIIYSAGSYYSFADDKIRKK